MCLLCACVLCVLEEKYTINITYDSGKYRRAILYVTQTRKIIHTVLAAEMRSAIDIC